MLIIGIDPGYSGAIALLDSVSGSLSVHDMPVLKTTKGKSDINMIQIAEILVPPTDMPCMAVMEKVSAMPGQGVSSVFRFGEQYGALRMALAGHRIRVHPVAPTVWKRHFGLSKDKGVSRGLATERFPAYADLFKRVKDDGRAEATLIALYGSEKLL